MLKYRLADFKLCEKDVIKNYLEGGIDYVKLMCVYSHIPLLVALTYVKQYEQSDRVDREIESLQKFYKAEVIQWEIIKLEMFTML